MGYLEKNKGVLQERYPELLKLIEKDPDSRETLEIECIEARDGLRALTVTKNGEKHRLNSAYRPGQEAAKWVEQYKLKNINVIVLMFGLGNGIFVKELLKNMEKDGELFVVEPSIELFRFVLDQEDITEILGDERFHLYVGDGSEQELKDETASLVNWNNISTQVSCAHPEYRKLFNEAYHKFWDVLDRINDVVITQANTNANFAYKAVENVLHNLPFIKESNYITELMGKMSEKMPAIIVAAGPSLDKNIDQLKKAKGKAFIIATDTAVKILENRKISYDCMITVDPGKPAWYLTEYPGCVDVPLFLEADSQWEIAGFHQGRKIWMPGSIYVQNLYTEHGLEFPPYNVGGSVATAAFMLAVLLGLKNIILIGQDLAYEGDKTHAGGFEDHILNEDDGIQMIDGIYGDPVRSRRDWVFFLKWYEEIIEQNPELNVIDATEGGALIHGSKVMDLSDAIDKYCQENFDFTEFLEEIPYTFENNDFEPLYQDIVHMKKGFKNIRYKAEEGIKIAEEFMQKGSALSAKRHDRIIKEIKKANNYIARQDGYELVEMCSSDLAIGELRDINCITGDAKTDEMNSVKSAYAIYKGFLDGMNQIEDLLIESIEKIV